MVLPPAETQSVGSSLANKSEQQVVSSGCNILATEIEKINQETDLPCTEIPATAVVEPCGSRRSRSSFRKRKGN